MKDNDIIKALECCGSYCCNECAYFNDDLCIENMAKQAIDLINRKNAELDKKDIEINILIRKKESLNDEISELKAEIERLQEDISTLNDEIYAIGTSKAEELADEFTKAQSEAIKEFAEMFYSLLADYADYDTLHIYEIKDRIDLVKEITERKEDK